MADKEAPDDDAKNASAMAQDGIPRRARTAFNKRPPEAEQAVNRAARPTRAKPAAKGPGDRAEEHDVAEALFDLMQAPSTKEEDDGPDGPKRKRPRAPPKRDEAEEPPPAAAAARKAGAADAAHGARKLDRRADAPDAGRRGGAGTGAAAHRAAGARGAADGGLARAGMNGSAMTMPLGMWPAGLAPGLGYFAPGAGIAGWPPGLAGGAGADGAAVAAQHLLLPPRRFKHCASHVYIAHFIDHQQQQQRYAFFQQQLGGAFAAPGVAPPDHAAVAAAAAAAAAAADPRAGGAVAAREAPDLARRMPPVAPPLAPFGFPGLMAGVDRGGASAPSLAAAQAQMQFAQLQSLALMQSGAFPFPFAQLSAQQQTAAATGGPLSHFYTGFGFPGAAALLPQHMALLQPPQAAPAHPPPPQPQMQAPPLMAQPPQPPPARATPPAATVPAPALAPTADRHAAEPAAAAPAAADADKDAPFAEPPPERPAIAVS